jgi:hypothetical protein
MKRKAAPLEGRRQQNCSPGANQKEQANLAHDPPTKQSAFAAAHAERERLIADQIRAARLAIMPVGATAALAASAVAAATFSEGQFLEAQRDASRRACGPIPQYPAAPAPIAAAIVQVSTRASRAGRPAVQHPKLHARDLRPPRVSTEGYLKRVRSATDGRAAGDPRVPVLMGVAAALARAWDYSGRAAQRGFRALATAGGICVETARKAVRWLESAGLLDTVNVIVRRELGGRARVVRDCNLYLPPPALENVPDPGPQTGADGSAGRTVTTDPAAIAGRTLARWAPLFGLAIRPHGWNRTPVRRRE